MMPAMNMQAMNPMMPMMNPMMMGTGMPMMNPMMMNPMMMNPMMMNPMMMNMPMPMMQGMACQCTMEMTKDGMVCKMMPMDPSAMEMLRERCNTMTAMMNMGMPMMMMMGGMPMMMCMPMMGKQPNPAVSR